jgi:hypothetical protein
MNLAKIVALVGVIAMGAIIAWAFAVGDFNAEGSLILEMPWGIVSLVDVYTSILLFSAWVIFRERAIFPTIIWIPLFIVLGNFATALYVLIALFQSKGDWKQFFLGKRAV